jgi:prepilin peptidase CpaA
MRLFSEAGTSLISMMGIFITVLLAAWYDWTEWRIPNRLLAASATAASMLALFFPHGPTIWTSLAGGLTGLALFLPLYMLRGMAAGDVKLMATLGLFSGPLLTIDIALLSCIAGGMWALVIMLGQTAYGQFVCLRLKALLGPKLSHLLSHPPQPQINSLKGKTVMPYGVVMAAGALGALLLAQG